MDKTTFTLTGYIIAFVMIFTATTTAYAADEVVDRAEGWVKGYEVGLEDQLETVEGEKFVRRTQARLHLINNKELYSTEGGGFVDFESRIGITGGHYKGSKSDPDIEQEYGDRQRAIIGASGDAAIVYTKNLGLINPFVGLSTEVEFYNHPRIEWQVDAMAGVKANISNDVDVRVGYQQTLAHGFQYFNDEPRYHQDDGYAINAIISKKLDKGAKHGVRLRFERFDKSRLYRFISDDGARMIGYEPKTDNWLVGYFRTFG